MSDEKRLTFKEFLRSDYDQIQEQIKNLESSEDPQAKELVSELKQLTPEDLAPSKADQELFKFRDYLVDEEDIELEDADQLANSVAFSAVAQAFVDIVSAMNDKTRDKWDKLIESNPNMLQIGFTLDAVSQMLLHKTYDELYDEHVIAALHMITQDMHKEEVQAQKLASLTKQQKGHIQKMMDMGYGDLANNLLEAFYDDSREA